MRGARGFEFVEGATGDLSFSARGATLEAVFAAAAEALLAATLENPGDLAERVERPVALAEPDLELLLLAYLNELVYLRDAEHLLLRAGELRVASEGEAHLVGRLVGEPIDRARHRLALDVKAATAHGLLLTPGESGWRARVTLDV